MASLPHSNHLSVEGHNPKVVVHQSSNNSLSASRSSLSKSRVRSKRKVYKFKFSNLKLSFDVRHRMYEMLIVFDDNSNMEFEESEIKDALVELLE